jgi:hypothetical protein
MFRHSQFVKALSNRLEAIPMNRVPPIRFALAHRHAAFLAVDLLHVRDSAWVTTDVPLALLVLWLRSLGYQAFATWAFAALLLLGFLLYYGYFAAFESLWGGQTPGKRAVGPAILGVARTMSIPAQRTIRPAETRNWRRRSPRRDPRGTDGVVRVIRVSTAPGVCNMGGGDAIPLTGNGRKGRVNPHGCGLSGVKLVANSTSRAYLTQPV